MNVIRAMACVGIVAVLATTVTACSSSADSADNQDTQALAASLVEQYGQAVLGRDQEALGRLLSGAYVLRRTDGSGYDREGFLEAIGDDSDYELVSYKIKDLQAKRDGDILVATFVLDGMVMENGKPVMSQPSTSLVTFVRVDDQWKLASDAFFSK